MMLLEIIWLFYVVIYGVVMIIVLIVWLLRIVLDLVFNVVVICIRIVLFVVGDILRVCNICFYIVCRGLGWFCGEGFWIIFLWVFGICYLLGFLLGW